MKECLSSSGIFTAENVTRLFSGEDDANQTMQTVYKDILPRICV